MPRAERAATAGPEAASAPPAPLGEELAARLDALRRVVGTAQSAVTAYSGGVDSALVMAIAHEVLGAAALACIGVSPSYPERERRAAVALAERLGARYRLVRPEELADPRYAANPDDRCFFCKNALHDQLVGLARAEGFAVVFDGTNADDAARVAVDRPGIRAARAHGVRSPLAEACLDKAAVRAVARHLGLPVWDKPAMACLASRVPHGDPITRALLERIERAEDLLVELGFRQLRVRVHREVTRIEVPPEDLAAVLAEREAIVAGFEALGHRFVTLDLAGFRSGSMNATRSGRELARGAEEDAR